jgi:peroxiredoxin
MTTRSDDVNVLPEGLPIPEDDGACAHLTGFRLPSLNLPSTAGHDIDLQALPGRTVVYIYPRTGRPDQEPPDGWNAFPGARGCTPQSCSFRDHKAELQALGANIFGLSTQDTAYQREAVERLHLPFELLSDEDFAFVQALRLPTFELADERFVKRITLILRDGAVEKVFYPVFPPDENVLQVLQWLAAHPIAPA